MMFCKRLNLSILLAIFVSEMYTLLVLASDAQNETVTVGNYSITENSTVMPQDESESGSSENKGAVAIAITITVIALIAVVVAVYFIRRRRQSLMMDKEKKMQMLMTSARNAGVYQDPTVSVLPDEKPPASPEHEKLNAAEEA